MRCKGVAYQKITSGKTKCKKGKKEEEERRKKGRRKNCARQANGNEKEEEEENRAKFEYKAVTQGKWQQGLYLSDLFIRLYKKLFKIIQNNGIFPLELERHFQKFFFFSKF